MITRLKKSKKGFTLVELIVVIAIIAILAAVTVPLTMTYVNKAKASSTKNQMEDIKTTLNNQIADLVSNSQTVDGAALKVILDKINGADKIHSVALDADGNITITGLYDDQGKDAFKEGAAVQGVTPLSVSFNIGLTGLTAATINYVNGAWQIAQNA